ncbi:hypothetical protein L7F22_067513 [Adiantum nelumboides]|nr:hypothetical protein [Adiantum nelumboides]
MFLMSKYFLFEKWGIDAIGPLPMAQSGKQYIIVGVDYMTRWAEAAATTHITAKEVAKFVFENICCRFGTPLEIIFERSPGFRGDLVGELMEQLGISRRHSSPYYPQCNGLVKNVNGMICRIIAKQANKRPKDWDRHLNAALWAYRTSFKANLGYTPYQLVFGKEAILPIKVQLASLRVLESGRDRPMQAVHRKKKFDENLKDKGLKRGMLVLRYSNCFDTRKDKKFMVRWEGPFLIYKMYTNGSYRLQDINGKLHKTRVNGWRLKNFFQRFDSTFMFDLPAGNEDEEEQPSSSHHHQH